MPVFGYARSMWRRAVPPAEPLHSPPSSQPRLTGGSPVSYTERTHMYFLVMFVHVVVCIFLIIVVLLQSGKAADLAGAVWGKGSQTAFGPRGSATLLSKATTISAVFFMVTSLSLSILATRNAGLGTSVLETAPQKNAPAQVPVSLPARAPAPAGGPIPVNVTPQKGDNPNELKIDMKDLKLPAPPAAPPAGQKSPGPATKK